eukprot:CAMPEP_0178819552 /NCGR_PEP_ID=MMETSP0746-20121128/3036_1 /TAXON_ID=913974 /ORGANISM="Nitzschia punctata, Strain CCMP561" /LENGTH=632 /DNA_ID=CAMNT_0020480831 /DNA_START=26 /DNA_END=1924 /DNA_ORIENTATION=+
MTVKFNTAALGTSRSSNYSEHGENSGVARKGRQFFALILFGGVGALCMLYYAHEHQFLQNEEATLYHDHPMAMASAVSREKEKIDNDERAGGDDNRSLLRHTAKNGSNFSRSNTTNSNILDLISTTTKTTQPSPSSSFRTKTDEAIQNEQVEEHPEEQHDQREKDDPLNVVLFYADDWTMKVLGKLDSNVYTPNIDYLADNGMLFTNNCVVSSMCWMSRATLVTGTYTTVHQQLWPHSMGILETLPWNETLFPLMKQQKGYYTGLVGKWHAPSPREYMTQAFDLHRFYYGKHWMGQPPNRQHVTDMNREHALEFLKRRPRSAEHNPPFFLKVSFFATHAIDGHYPSYEPMNTTRRQYYNDSCYIKPGKTATEEHWLQLPSFLRRNNEGRTRWRKRFEPDYFQDNIKDLYSLATEVDWAIGEVVQELKEQGVFNKTMIIFTTDNGNLHGEHGLTEKWYPFEESLRVPLVIYDPRMPKQLRGTRSDKWTLNVDLAPTILGAANMKPSSFMQGRDISQLYLEQKEDTSPAWREDFFYEFNMGNPNNASDHPWKHFIDASFALVTDEWKYVVWPQHNYEQLFHRSVDPYDEWDLLHKIENTTNASFKLIQSNDEIYQHMKSRYLKLKERAQGGLPI